MITTYNRNSQYFSKNPALCDFLFSKWDLFFIWKAEWERKREGREGEGRENTSSTHWFTPLKVMNTRAGPGQTQEPRIPSESPTWAAGSAVLKPSSAAFPGIHGTGSEQSSWDSIQCSNIRCGHPKRQLNPTAQKLPTFILSGPRIPLPTPSGSISFSRQHCWVTAYGTLP